MSIDVAEMLRRVCRFWGIDAFYGTECAPLNVTAVPEALADTFALAHERVHGSRAGVYRGNGVFLFPGTGPRRVVEVTGSNDLLDATQYLATGGEVELRLLVPLDQPVDDLMPQPVTINETWLKPHAEVIESLNYADRVIVLAGPGVVRESAVPGLHDLAVKGNFGVLNTWGAKGVFDWRSRHHLATVGLQEYDFALGGLSDADLIVATGLDPLESPEIRWQLAPAVTVPPGALAPLAEECRWRSGEIVMPPLRNQLAGVTQRGWTVEEGPLPPTRVTLHYSECLSAGALVAADAGVAGFWVARTLGTTRLRGVIVPSSPIPGFAAACVVVSVLRQPDRPALAVVDQSGQEQTGAVVDAAKTLEIDVAVETWDPEGEQLDAASHRQRLWRMLGGGGAPSGGPPSLATDGGQLADMIEAAGPVVAWQ